VIGITIATHGATATALGDTATELLGVEVPGLTSVGITADMNRSHAWDAMVGAVDTVDQGDGVLVLVDMFGGTPATLAMALLAERKVHVLTGVNLAMVLRSVLKRETHDLDSLSADVLAYGRRNVTSSVHWLAPPPENDR